MAVRHFPLLSKNFQLAPGKGPEYGFFVPEFSEVPDVETSPVDYFYYTGPDVEGYKNGYFYKKNYSQEVVEVETYTIPSDTLYIDVFVDNKGVPAGRYYRIPDYKFVEALKIKYNNQLRFMLSVFDADDGNTYEATDESVFKVGDWIWNKTTREDFTITEIIHEDSGDILTRISNGAEMRSSRGSGSGGTLTAFVKDSGEMVFWSSSMSSVLGVELREYTGVGPSALFAYITMHSRSEFDFGRTTRATDLTVTTVISPAVANWEQCDTQPRNTDYKLTSPDGSKYVLVENSGTTVNGNLNILGDLNVSGKETVVEIVDVESEQNYITLRKNNPLPLDPTDRAGITIENYDGQGTHLVLNVGADGVARVGDEGDEEPLMTRDEAGNLSEGQVIIWDSANKKAVGITLDNLFAKYVQEHTMSEADYWAAVDAGTLKANNLYFTPVN